MSETVDQSTRAGLLDQWHRQIGNRIARHDHTPRDSAIVTWLARGRNMNSLIDTRGLTVVVLHDQIGTCGEVVIRFAGYWAEPVPWGLRWGSASSHRFEKSVSLSPRCGAGGSRLDLNNRRLAQLALRLDARLQVQVDAQNSMPASALRLPPLWAGFLPATAESVTGEGPELCGMCHTSGESSQTLMHRYRCELNGLVLFPLAWVSHHWCQIMAVFADFRKFPRYQTVALDTVNNPLRGFRAACEFDFLTSRFHKPSRQKNGKPRPKQWPRTEEHTITVTTLPVGCSTQPVF